MGENLSYIRRRRDCKRFSGVGGESAACRLPRDALRAPVEEVPGALGSGPSSTLRTALPFRRHARPVDQGEDLMQLLRNSRSPEELSGTPHMWGTGCFAALWGDVTDEVIMEQYGRAQLTLISATSSRRRRLSWRLPNIGSSLFRDVRYPYRDKRPRASALFPSAIAPSKPHDNR